MTIRSVSVENYRPIESLTLPLHPQMTVLHGANGSGKTSILTAIALALAPDVYGTARRVELDRHEGSAGTPTITLDYGDVSRTRVEGRAGPPDRNAGWGHSDMKQGLRFVVGEADGGGMAPAHMFYDTDREVVSSLTERYVGTRANYDELFDWFYAKENEELRLQRERKDFEARDDDLSSVRNAICSMLRGASEPHIDMRGNGPARFAITLRDEAAERRLSLEQLSGGYQSMLSVAADIAWRLAKYRRSRTPRLRNRGTVVLIDEVELHLHPAWQQRVLDDLMRTFPDVQFVVSTHSPQVLTTVHQEHIVELAVEDGGVVAGGPPAPTYGAAAGDVLTGVMGVSKRPDNEFTRLLDEYLRLVSRDRGETEQARKIRARLDELSCRDPALSDADVEIRHRKLVRRRDEP